MFLLIAISEREISSVKKFDTKEEAQAEMLDELLAADQFIKDAYESEADENGCVNDSDTYGINYDGAWANVMGGKLLYDWFIIDTNNINNNM